MTPEHEAQRGSTFWTLRGSPVLILRVVLIALAISTGMGLFLGITQRATIVASFPGAARPAVFLGLLFVASAVVVFGLVYINRARYRRPTGPSDQV